MDDTQFAEIAAWINNAGLGGQDEAAIVTEFCARTVALGLPLARGQVFIDTLHPVYGGRGYYWQAAKGETIATCRPSCAVKGRNPQFVPKKGHLPL